MSESVIVRKHDFSCSHNKYVIDERLNIVECGICGKELNPMWVLKQIADGESRFSRNIESIKEKIEKTKNKLRCKCQHCGKITRISR